jgi:hypothetical protein
MEEAEEGNVKELYLSFNLLLNSLISNALYCTCVRVLVLRYDGWVCPLVLSLSRIFFIL